MKPARVVFHNSRRHLHPFRGGVSAVPVTEILKQLQMKAGALLNFPEFLCGHYLLLSPVERVLKVKGTYSKIRLHPIKPTGFYQGKRSP